MEQQAKVTSVDALENFRASLILFLSKAKPALEEVMHEVVRTRLWIEGEQRSHWERELKTRRRKLEQAQAELFSARISKIQEASAAQQMAVQHATRAIHAAEEKMRVLKKWNRELENRADPLVKQIEQLHGFLTNEMVRAMAFLAEAVKILQSYAEVSIGTRPLPAAISTETDSSASATDAAPAGESAPIPKS
jgi:predicted  nucleic acid-binding Zn-ribbon protein